MPIPFLCWKLSILINDNFDLCSKVYYNSMDNWNGILNLCWWHLQEVLILHSIANWNTSAVRNRLNLCNWRNVGQGYYFLIHPICDQFSLWRVSISIEIWWIIWNSYYMKLVLVFELQKGTSVLLAVLNITLFGHKTVVRHLEKNKAENKIRSFCDS